MKKKAIRTLPDLAELIISEGKKQRKNNYNKLDELAAIFTKQSQHLENRIDDLEDIVKTRLARV
jgi:gas vesicle protein